MLNFGLPLQKEAKPCAIDVRIAHLQCIQSYSCCTPSARLYIPRDVCNSVKTLQSACEHSCKPLLLLQSFYTDKDKDKEG